MASASTLQKVSQRVKNASLKLTNDTTTHCPFMRRVNSIIQEFEVESALKFRFTEKDDGKSRSSQGSIQSVLTHAKFADAVLAMSDEDLEKAHKAAKAPQEDIDICKAILTNAIPALCSVRLSLESE